MELQNALRDKIVSCICTMDVRMLDVLLPDHGRYEHAYKEVWLERLKSFFKKCQKMGDTVLTVERRAWSVDDHCDCRDDVWLFKSEKTGKGFAIYFIMDGDEIKGIGRCFGQEGDSQEMKPNNEAFEYEAFYIYDHEKIGFVDSLEYKALRKEVKLFIKDIMNPKRHTLGLIGLKRKMVDYNDLYFDVSDVPYLFEYKLEMLKLYEDWFALKKIFSARKGFQQVMDKCHELMQCSDQKSKVRVMKWFVRHEAKVKSYLVYHFALQVEPNRVIYQYEVDGAQRKLIIRHPKINNDVKAFNFFLTFGMRFYSYLFDRYFTDFTIYDYIETKWTLYQYFKDQMDEVVEEFEGWDGERENVGKVVD